MGVLDIKDRVVLALAGGQGEVEFQLAVRLAHQEEKAGRVRPHLVEQFIDGDEVGLAGGHLDLLAVPHQGDELVDHRGDLGRIVAQGLYPGQHVRDGGDMVGAEDIDHPIKTPAEFFPVIGDIRQPVGGLAAGFDDHPILLQPQGGGLEPDRPVLLVNQPLFPEGGDHILHQAVFVEGVLVIIVVELDLQPIKGMVDVGENNLLGLFGEGRRLGHVLEGVTLLGDQGLGDLPDILALVAVLGKGKGQPEQFQITGPGRFAQHPHLAAGIIVVILPGHRMAGGDQQPGNGVAQHRLAAVADAQGAGGIGADKLHQHLGPRPSLAKAEIRPLAVNLRQ